MTHSSMNHASEHFVCSDRVTLKEFYRRELFENVIPFWLLHGIDSAFGGIITSLDRDGTIVDTDKGIWQQGRAAWLFGRLYNTFEAQPEYLEHARHMLSFLDRFGTDPTDGRMWFHVTRQGQPIRKRRYAFSESFAAIAYGELYRATGERQAKERALQLFSHYIAHTLSPPPQLAKFTDTRPLRSLGGPMIAINTAQELRNSIGFVDAGRWIDWGIETIRRFHLHEELRCVMENVPVQGGVVLDHFDGRTLNPGHAIEGAWFILWEGYLRQDSDLVELGCMMLDWMWERGWDKEYGGLLYFVSANHQPVTEYWHTMKFWWPHNEAIIATLLAWALTGNEKYARWHDQVHRWAFAHFPDPEYGEWFGYLDRAGKVTSSLKGNLWKGFFHLPRMLIFCIDILEKVRPWKV